MLPRRSGGSRASCRTRKRCRPRCAIAVTYLAGITADRAGYDTLLALARKSTVTNERLRYYFAAASARDPELARATLALTLTDELPNTIIGGIINTVASSGEQPDLAWDFVQSEFRCPCRETGTQSFRDAFVAQLHDQFHLTRPMPPSSQTLLRRRRLPAAG